MCRAVARVLPVLLLAHVGLVVARTLLVPCGPWVEWCPPTLSAFLRHMQPGRRPRRWCSWTRWTCRVSLSGFVLLSASCSLLSRLSRLTCVLVLHDWSRAALYVVLAVRSCLRVVAFRRSPWWPGLSLSVVCRSIRHTQPLGSAAAPGMVERA